MARALRLAQRGHLTTHPNPRVGCVIVRDGVVIGEGFHARAGEAHAEVHALAQAGEQARGAELFVTLEPCSHHGRTPPCADAVIAAGVRKVWVAMQDPNPLVSGQGIQRLLNAGVEVDVGLLQLEAERINRGFVRRMRTGRPWVSLKLAASFDGRTAMASGESRWISSAASRADVHRIRAAAGAVLTGIETVLHDDPQLNVRGLQAVEPRQPDRIVLDARARTPVNANVWAPGARRYWIVGQHAVAEAPAEVAVLRLPQDDAGRLSLLEVLPLLGHAQINEVLIEAGPRLAGAFLQAGCVDEVIAYVAPCLLGDAARPFAVLPGLDQLAQRVGLEWLDVRRIGPDLRIIARPVGAAVH